MDDVLKESWARQSDDDVRKAMTQLEDFEPDTVNVIQEEAKKRGITIESVQFETTSMEKNYFSAFLKKIFTKDNFVVGWSCVWFGILLGVPLTCMVYALYIGSSVSWFFYPLWLAVLIPSLIWSWRRIQYEGLLIIRAIITFLIAIWILICPFNYTFYLSSCRAVHRYHKMIINPLSYLGSFVGFGFVLGVTWFVTGLPLGMVLESSGPPGDIQMIVFGLWLILFPWGAIFLLGYLINDIADQLRPLQNEN